MAWTLICWVLYALRGIRGTWRDSACLVSSPRAYWLKVAFKNKGPKDFLPGWRLTLCCRWSIGVRLLLVSFWLSLHTRSVGRSRAAALRSCLTLWPRIYEVSVVKSFRISRCGHSLNCLRHERFSAM